jgi:hypothetical protein
VSGGLRGASRRLRLGLATLAGAKRGFFIPYRHAASVEPEAYPALEPLFEAAVPRFLDVLGAIEAYGDDLGRIAAGQGPARFDQDWFPALDAGAAYAIVRRERPARIVEIGSGHSTRFLAQAVLDGGLTSDIVCVDPKPRAGIAGLPVRHIASLLRDADPGIFAALRAGDILFVDSSHIAMPGTDVADRARAPRPPMVEPLGRHAAPRACAARAARGGAPWGLRDERLAQGAARRLRSAFILHQDSVD